MASPYIGTSGWSYPSWRPDFYPAGLANEDFLGFYAERFPSVELNSTGYRLPSEEQFRRWAAATPDGFRFAVKASPQALRSFGTFEERVRMLGDRLGPVRVVVESPRDDGLLALLLGSTDLRLALDLRDESWAAPTSRPPSGSTTVTPTARSGISVSASRRTPSEQLGGIAATIEPLLAAGLEVYAYFQHEDAPTAPAYAARLLELVRADDR